MDLPIIDFGGFISGGAENQKRIADEIGQAAENIGFFVLKNHGLPRLVRSEAFDMAARFFDLPEDQKRRIEISLSPCHRGWYGEGGEVLDARLQPEGDVKQGLKIGRDLSPDHPRVKAGIKLHGPNQWPEEDATLSGFKASMQNCYAACETLSRQLMRAFAVSLGLSDDYFDIWLKEPMATLSPLRYPAMRDDDALSAGAHTDFGCLTLLMQKDQAGLEIETASGWQAIPCLPDQIVVNIGDMMQRWTNGRYASTRHRVVNRSGRVRHSMAYFFDPDPDARLAPLPGCGGGDEPPLTALDHLRHKIDESFAYRTQ